MRVRETPGGFLWIPIGSIRIVLARIDGVEMATLNVDDLLRSYGEVLGVKDA